MDEYIALVVEKKIFHLPIRFLLTFLIFLCILGLGIVIGYIYAAYSHINTSHQKGQDSPIVTSQAQTSTVPNPTTNQTVTTDTQLLSMASAPVTDGSLPLGDNKYLTSGPKQGYIYLCSVPPNGQGAKENGSWIHGSAWNPSEKISVEGSVSWPQATFSDTLQGDTRILKGNGLPVGYTTGIFPIQPTDPAYQVDQNPNSITAQNLVDDISANPTYSVTPYCISGEVGVMNSGIPLFDAFDAELRDAGAHEMQDACNGHPEKDGEYHYHSLSNCFKDINETTVLGFALDGFPITGPEVATNKYLTTANLDECHGITSSIILDGKPTITYHYVMTQDFPYSASCFRAKPIQPYRPNTSSQLSTQPSVQQTSPQASGTQNQPPEAAIVACSGKSIGASCSFTPQGKQIVTGTCQTPPGSSLACVPS